jgi:Rad3-related DNA helicase
LANASLLGEWSDLVDAWQLKTWEAYKDVKRLGRKTRLSESAAPCAIWAVFERAQEALKQAGLITHAEMFRAAWQRKPRHLPHQPFDFVVVDEAQDVSVRG